MNGRVTIDPDPTGRAGYAVIRVKGLPAGAAPRRFGLRRGIDYREPSLGPAGWQVADALLEPEKVTMEGDTAILTVGPSVCNLIETGSFEFRLPDAGVTETVQWPNIRPQHAGVRRAFRPPPPPVEGQPDRRPEPAASPPKPVPTPMPVHQPPDDMSLEETMILPRPQAGYQPMGYQPGGDTGATPGRPWLIPLLLVAGLAVLGGGGYGTWRYMHPAAQPANQPSEPAQPSPVPPGDAVDLSHMSVPAIVARDKPAEMLEEANRRMADGRRDDGLVLLSEAADRHYPPAVAALAKFYDPVQPHAPGAPANARRAAQYYREAAQSGDASVRTAREALKNWLQARAGNNAMSDESLILKDFWP